MDNADLRKQAGTLFPGGVSSPVRSFRATGGEPVPIVRAADARVFDAEGGEYIDYVAAYGPLILGHAHPSRRGGARQGSSERHRLRGAVAGRG